jgi:hypothetical protein
MNICPYYSKSQRSVVQKASAVRFISKNNLKSKISRFFVIRASYLNAFSYYVLYRTTIIVLLQTAKTIFFVIVAHCRQLAHYFDKNMNVHARTVHVDTCIFKASSIKWRYFTQVND